MNRTAQGLVPCMPGLSPPMPAPPPKIAPLGKEMDEKNQLGGDRKKVQLRHNLIIDTQLNS